MMFGDGIKAVDESIDISYLFSEPLVSGDSLTPISNIDVQADMDILSSCLKEAKRQVKFRFDACTIDNLRTIITKGVHAIHYSGHGTPDHCLSFEDSRGCLHRNFSIEKLKTLFEAGSTSGVDFVFVAACNSEYVGRAFAEAGVSHVVAVRCDTAKTKHKNTHVPVLERKGEQKHSISPQTLLGDIKLENPLNKINDNKKNDTANIQSQPSYESSGLVTDHASRVFSHAFYLSLLLGNTVKDSFDIGKARVLADPKISASLDANKFLLLPEDESHDSAVFKLSVGDLQDVTPTVPSRLPTLEADFDHRNIEIFGLVGYIMSKKRLTVVRGVEGIGKTSVVLAACHYLLRRHYIPILYLDISEIDRMEDVLSYVMRELKQFKNMNMMLALGSREYSFTPVKRSYSVQSDDSKRELNNPTLSPMSSNNPLISVLSGEDNIVDDILNLVNELNVKFGSIMLVIDDCTRIIRQSGKEFRQLLLGRLLSTCKSTKILVVSSVSVGKVPHVASNVLHVGPLKPIVAMKVFHSLCPRKLSTEEIMKAVHKNENEQPISDPSLSRIFTNRPDLLARHKLISILQGNPLAISLASSLLEDLSFAHLQHLLNVYLEQEMKLDSEDELLITHPELDDTLTKLCRLTRRQKCTSKNAINTQANTTGQTGQLLENDFLYCSLPPRDDSKLEEADTLRSLSIVKLQMGDTHTLEALSHVNDAMTIYKEKNDSLGFAAASQLVAEIRMISESVDASCLPSLEEALQIYREHGDQTGEAWTLKVLAEMHLLLVQERSGEAKWDGNSHSKQAASILKAKQTITTAMGLFLELNNRNGEAAALRVRGRVNLSFGNRIAAQDDLNAAHTIFVSSGNVLGDAGTLRLLGVIKAQMREYEGAKSDLTLALDKYRSAKQTGGEMTCLKSLGNLHFRENHLDEATKCLQDALSIAETRESITSKRAQRQERAFILRALGETLVASGDLSAGLATLEEAVPLFRELNREAAVEDTMRVLKKGKVKQSINQPTGCGPCIVQ